MALDMTSGDALLKEIFADKLENLVYKNWPLLAMVPRGQWDGKSFHQPLRYANLAGVSNTFANAMTNKGNSSQASFEVTLKQIHSIGSVSDVLIETSKNNRGAVVRALESETESGLNAAMNKLSQQIFRSGSGSLGQVGSLTATVITLKDPADVVNFEKGMVVAQDTVDGGGTVGNTAAITAIDRQAGTLTFSAVPSGAAVDDYLFQDGDYDAALSGIAAWDPISAPSASTFFGVDRTVDSTRLGGVRVTAAEVSGLPIEEKLQVLLSRVAREGGVPDVVAMNFENLRDLEISLGSKVVYDSVQTATVGFKAVSIVGPSGAVKVIADRHCPNNRVHALQLDTWTLRSTSGGDPSLQEHDGNTVLREGSNNNYEFRIRLYGNLICSAPGYNGIMDLS